MMKYYQRGTKEGAILSRFVADKFLHTSVLGFNSVPKFQGAYLRKFPKKESTGVEDRIGSDYLYYLSEAADRRAKERSEIAIASLFDMCLTCFCKNRQQFTYEDVLRLPYTIQDMILAEILSNEQLKFSDRDECLDVFLSTQTRHLTLPVSNSITDCTIRKVAQRCPNLVDLTLCGFVHLTDDCVEQIAIYCAGIKFLDLSFCTNVTDKGISFLAKSCVKLKRLLLHQCSQVSYQGILAIARYCKQLQVLDITGTRFCEDSLLFLLRNSLSLKTVILWNKPFTKAYLERVLLDNDYFENGVSESEWLAIEDPQDYDAPSESSTKSFKPATTKAAVRKTDMLLYPSSKFFQAMR